ncbi:MAG: DNA polymerase III subunit gamma/tau [Halobacteriovoraceae bacterium]|nr:DNA polymerase III subunit gamma/tau [Halobacteriovoraceae bacterium]
MSYEVLARKWRPKNFSQVIGQDHIVRALKGALRTKQVAHAYLLTGTRGIGKTSIARILAKALNCSHLSEECEPCLECEFCQAIDKGNSLHYNEIDGASHNSVENIRALIENLRYLPTEGKFRIVVIDEVHMLSTSAFNALLKTLEEPPEHVIFIFATTDPQKLLDTVVSRCQRLDLRQISQARLIEIVTMISEKEGITFENPRVKEVICSQGKGSVRDTLTLLDQLKQFSEQGVISEESLFMSLGIAKTNAVSSIVNSILEGKAQAVSQYYKECLNENIDLKNFCNQILDYLYDKIQGEPTEELISLYESMNQDIIWGLNSLNPAKVVEIILQKNAMRAGGSQPRPQKPKTAARMAVSDLPRMDESELKAQKKHAPIFPKTHSQKTETTPVPEAEQGFTLRGFLKFLKEKRPASEANLEMGNLEYFKREGEKIKAAFAFSERSRLFFDYFQEKDVLEGMKQSLAEYLKCPLENLELKFTILSEEEVSKKKFISLADIAKTRQVSRKNELKKEFFEQSMVTEAEKLFGSKIDLIEVNQQ